MKQSINNTFTAEKVSTFSVDRKTKVSEHVRIKKTNGAIGCVMFPDKTVHIMTGVMSVAQVVELSGFLQWVEINYWNI